MNSKYEKRLSLEELTKLNEQAPKEEPRTIQISEEEWTRLSALLQRMEMLTEQKNTEERNLTETANTLKKLTEEQSQEQDETETLSEDESQAPVTQTM